MFSLQAVSQMFSRGVHEIDMVIFIFSQHSSGLCLEACTRNSLYYPIFKALIDLEGNLVEPNKAWGTGKSESKHKVKVNSIRLLENDLNYDVVTRLNVCR